MTMKKRIFALLAALALLLTACASDPNSGKGESSVPSDPVMQTEPTAAVNGISPLRYPADAVMTAENRGTTVSALCRRAAGETSYRGNGHYDGTNLVISPFYTATVNEADLPVYATPVYVADGNYGTLHSFASVDVDFTQHETATITLVPEKRMPLKTAQLFAQGDADMLCANGQITLKVRQHGVYTVVINDTQNYAITVFVRTWEDEDAAIARYQEQYGKDHVTVFEPGIHEIDYLLMLQDNSVLYLKAGAILLPKHTIDIQSDAAASKESEFGAIESNALGLNRYPVINGYSCDNVTIAGRGTVDMTQLDWHERRGVVFSLCNGVTVDGVILINPCEWAFITYRCTDVTVTQSAVLGYRTNSDAFAICNSINVSVSDCFARTGDDMFEVKTLGGPDTAVSRDITFSRCTAWGSKARCFGIIGEIEKDVSNILFEDGIVVFRDATWDNDRIGSLIVLREGGSGVVDGVTFRDMTIHYDFGRAINVGVYSSGLVDSKIQNVVFENVTYRSVMKSQIRANNGQTLSVTFRNVSANGNVLSNESAGTWLIWDRDGLMEFQ